MLQIEPHILAAIRKSREGRYGRWEKERSREKVGKPHKPRKLKKEYRRRLIQGTATILKMAEPTPFAFEAFCRHEMRSGLCLRGWPWADADAAAAEIVAAALNMVGARRPTWQQGQPEYVQFGVVLEERTRCVVCGWKLPEGHRLYCSSTCFEVKRHDRRHKWENAYDYAANREVRWITALGGAARRG